MSRVIEFCPVQYLLACLNRRHACPRDRVALPASAVSSLQGSQILATVRTMAIIAVILEIDFLEILAVGL